MKNKTKRIALCGVFCSLSVVLLYLGSLVDVLDLSCAALASFLVMFAQIEYGRAYPVLVFFVTSLASLLLLPSKLPAVFYAVFLGYYPIAKFYIEKKSSRTFSWILKFILFNIALTALLFICTFVLSLEDTNYIFGALIYLFGNIVFAVYDIALSRVISAYLLVWRKKLRIK